MPPTPSAAVEVFAVTPNRFSNDRPVTLTLTGAHLVPGLSVAVGNLSLVGVAALSPARITGIVPLGLCPGSYPVTVTDPSGHHASGGTVAVQGTHTVSFGVATGSDVVLDGRDRRAVLRLPPMHVRDTTCDGRAWRLAVSISGFAPPARGRPTLLPRDLRVSGADGRIIATRPLIGADDQRQTRLVIPHARGVHDADLALSLAVDVPANSYAGPRSLTISIDFVPE